MTDRHILPVRGCSPPSILDLERARGFGPWSGSFAFAAPVCNTHCCEIALRKFVRKSAPRICAYLTNAGARRVHSIELAKRRASSRCSCFTVFSFFASGFFIASFSATSADRFFTATDMTLAAAAGFCFARIARRAALRRAFLALLGPPEFVLCTTLAVLFARYISIWASPGCQEQRPLGRISQESCHLLALASSCVQCGAAVVL